MTWPGLLSLRDDMPVARLDLVEEGGRGGEEAEEGGRRLVSEGMGVGEGEKSWVGGRVTLGDLVRK